MTPDINDQTAVHWGSDHMYFSYNVLCKLRINDMHLAMKQKIIQTILSIYEPVTFCSYLALSLSC
jgi:hypothetical protein